MARTTIDRLIVNSPFQEPARHWRYERETRIFHLMEGGTWKTSDVLCRIRNQTAGMKK